MAKKVVIKEEILDQKQEALREAMAGLQKKYGKGFITTLEEAKDFEVQFVSTKCLTLDYILGGGLAKGRLYELYGENSAGKSTLALFIMAQIQKMGGTVAFLDAENAFNSEFAEKLGVDINSMILSQETCLEYVFETMNSLINTNAVDLIVVDSVASLVPLSDLEGTLEDKEGMAKVARLMSRGLRNIVGPLAKSKAVIIFINQLRDNLDMFSYQKTITPGGKALKFYASVRAEVKKGEKFLDKDKSQIGNVLKIKITKNKVGFPFKEGEIGLYYSSGIDLIADTFTMGEKLEIITKTGNTYSYKETKLGVGTENAKEFLSNNSEIFQEINNIIKEKMTTI